MSKERKYLDEYEMSLLLKYGIDFGDKKKIDVTDLLNILPKSWKNDDSDRKEAFRIEWDYGMGEWVCNSPVYAFRAGPGLVSAVCNSARGDTMVSCLLNAVLRIAKNPCERDMLSKTVLVKGWRFEEVDNKIDFKILNKLRQETSAGLMTAKQAYIDANFNYDEAVKLLKQKNFVLIHYADGKRDE